ncbi:peptidoglycan -binding protein [Oleisolibacter albus]|uniref:peptidoglycan -binding protein n=1 Tax=Oleisolibacter albus TaxID=2171757 RepID=UPI000DF391F4|nr:peptidoglycan -binding protein [Oleisolibacter albus]
MAAWSRRGGRSTAVDVWPGWVDALSSLIMVVVFLLMVFVVAQFYLSTALQGRDRELAQLNSRIAQLADLLALEKDNSAKLQADITSLTDRLRATLSSNEQLQSQLNALGAERDQLAGRLTQLGDTVQQRQGELEAERQVSAEAKAQVDLLNQQIAALRQQLAELSQLLDASEKKAKEQDVQIADLGKRLNAALAGKVAELARFRSEFFGRLRELLGNREDVRIVGDRFVFQSELLFESGSAELGDGGRQRLAALAATLKQIAATLPQDLNWILRIDGHTDVVPIKTDRFASNWELSTARAISVVRFLVQQGIAPERLAATGFGEFQPLDNASSPEALARNRRIEIKLDSR